MKKILLFIFCFIAAFVNAQDKTVVKLKTESERTIKKDNDTSHKLWKKGGIFNLNLAQTSLSNWAAGGDNFSLSLNSLISAYAFYKKDKISWDNTFDFNFGYLKTTTLGSRKNDDRLDLLSKFGYGLSSKWDASILFDFRTQVANGYTYTDNQKTFSSAFLSPAYVLLSPGFNYKATKNFSVFISPATIRWVIVKNDSLAAHGEYGVTPGHHSKAEFGAFASAIYIKDFNKIVSYNGRLDLFSNYEHNPEKVDVYMTNLLAVKLSKILSLTWSFDLIYDDDIRIFGPNKDAPALQIKSLVGLGMLVKF